MALDPDAKRRWRERRIGNVPLGSGRGVAAAILIGAAVALAISNPLLVTLAWVAGEDTASQEITLDLLILNFVFNAVVLVVLPVAGLAVARPKPSSPDPVARHGALPLAQPWTSTGPPPIPQGTWSAVIRRLGLEFTPRTFAWIALGVGAAIGSLMSLGGIIFLLTELGMEQPEESPLIAEIDALLTWPLVFIIPLVASMTEEIFFRGVLQPRIGLIASSLFFGIVHIGYGTGLQVVAPVFLGFLFGFLFLRTRSLWSAIAAHYTFDLIQLLALKLTQ